MSLLKRPLMEADGLVDITRDHLYNSDILNNNELKAIQRLNNGQNGLKVDLAAMEEAFSAVRLESLELEKLNFMIQDIHSRIQGVWQEYDNIFDIMRKNEEIMVKRAGIRPPAPSLDTEKNSTETESRVSGGLQNEKGLFSASFDVLRQKVKEHSESPLFSPVPGDQGLPETLITTKDYDQYPGTKLEQLQPHVPENADGNTPLVMDGNEFHKHNGEANTRYKETAKTTKKLSGTHTESTLKMEHETAGKNKFAQSKAGALGLLAGSLQTGFKGPEKETVQYSDGGINLEKDREISEERIETSLSPGSEPRYASIPKSAVSMMGGAAAVTMIHSTVVPPMEIKPPRIKPEFATEPPSNDIISPAHESGTITEMNGLARIQERKTPAGSEKLEFPSDESTLKVVKEKQFMPSTEHIPLDDSGVENIRSAPLKPISGKKEGIHDETEMPTTIKSQRPISREPPITLASLCPKDITENGLKSTGATKQIISYQGEPGFEPKKHKSNIDRIRNSSTKGRSIKTHRTAQRESPETPWVPSTALSMLSDAASGTFGLGLRTKNDIINNITDEQISFRENLEDFTQNTAINNGEMVASKVPSRAETPGNLTSTTYDGTTPSDALSRKLPRVDHRKGGRTNAEKTDSKISPVPPGSIEKISPGNIPRRKLNKESIISDLPDDSKVQIKPIIPEGVKDKYSSISPLHQTPSVPDNDNPFLTGFIDLNDHRKIVSSTTTAKKHVEPPKAKIVGKDMSSSTDNREVEAAVIKIESGNLEILNIEGRGKIPALESQLPESTQHSLDHVTELKKTNGRIPPLIFAEKRTTKTSLPFVPPAEKNSGIINYPKLDEKLLEPLRTMEILNFFSIDQGKLKSVIENSIEKEHFTSEPYDIEKAMDIVTPAVQKIREQAANIYFRDVNFNSAVDKGVTQWQSVPQKKFSLTTLAEVPPGPSQGLSPEERTQQDHENMSSPPGVTSLGPDLPREGSDITLLKSLERLRELKLLDLTMKGSKNEKIKSRGEDQKSRADKREITEEIEKKGLYEIIEVMIEEEAKRHGLVFR